MLGVLGRRGVEAVISAFAVLGFCYVPLGQHTGLEHAQAVLNTAPAKRAALELMDALGRARRSLSERLEELGSAGVGVAPTSSAAAAPSQHVHFRHAQPKPNPPHLGPVSAF